MVDNGDNIRIQLEKFRASKVLGSLPFFVSGQRVFFAAVPILCCIGLNVERGVCVRNHGWLGPCGCPIAR